MVLENYETSLADLTCKLATTISDISQKQESLSMLSAELTDLRQQQSSQLSEYIEQK